MKYPIIFFTLCSLWNFNATAQACGKEISLVSSLFEKLNVEQALADPRMVTAEFDNLKSTLGDFSAMRLKKMRLNVCCCINIKRSIFSSIQ